MQSIQRKMDGLSQKRPSKSKVSTGFERLQAEKAEVRRELDRYKEEIGKLNLSKILLLQQYRALYRKIEELDRLKEQGIEEMSDDEFLSTKGTFSDLLGTFFTSGGCVLSAEGVKEYVQRRTAETKDHEKDQIIASLYL